MGICQSDGGSSSEETPSFHTTLFVRLMQTPTMTDTSKDFQKYLHISVEAPSNVRQKILLKFFSVKLEMSALGF